MNSWLASARGSERAYALIGTSVIIILGFLLVVLGTPFLKNMSLSQYAQELVNYDYQNNKPNPSGVYSIQSKLVNRIKQKKMPITESQVIVDYDLYKYTVKIDYIVKVNLLFTTIDWNFSIRRATEKR
ncbi:hypothetical protein JXA80_12510 [bacterium]|nr:hypothetical protein [candidate division CSSED10-310 bacterium]